MPFRTKYMDPDFRRDPKTSRYCIMCSRDLKPGQPHRIVKYELDKGYEAIHPQDFDAAEKEIKARWAPHQQDNCVVTDRVGMDCARNLGLEWTFPGE